MKEYRIAFFTADWNYELVETTLHGLKQFTADHANVRLRIFDCFGKDADTAKDRSEYAVFDLADLSQFDGLLVQGNQIVLDPVRREISRRIVAAGIPAVTLDCPMEGCTLVAIDNEKAQRDITEHVIRRHGARRLVYLTGLLDNGCPEARQRMDGFLAAGAESGIPRDDLEVIPCTWRTSDGIDVGQRWTREGRPLPDAFVCANDEMALGLIQGLAEGGVKVPGDVIVTGFDGLSSAELSSPRLSTVYRDNRAMIYYAMQVLLEKIDGKVFQDPLPFGHSLICSESCGCGLVARPGYIRDKYFQQTRFLKDFYTFQDQMAEELFDTSDLLELMDIVEKNHSIFGCDSVYICVNDYYFDNYDKKQWNQNSEVFGREMILAACGRRRIAGDEGRAFVRFPTQALLPESLMRDERFLVFYPLHYNTYSIGYLVMNGISEAAKLNLHKSIFSFLEIAIDNVRKKGLLHQLNDVLDNLYVHDALTGLYNRFGFERYGEETFRGFLSGAGHAQVLFVDMDDMKTINDRYGHEVGDAAIRATAHILRQVCGPRDFLMRYGGDEFLMISGCRDDSLGESIQEAVRLGAFEPSLPCPLSLSIGVIHADAGDSRTLDNCVREADARMYERKNRKKEERA